MIQALAYTRRLCQAAIHQVFCKVEIEMHRAPGSEVPAPTSSHNRESHLLEWGFTVGKDPEPQSNGAQIAYSPHMPATLALAANRKPSAEKETKRTLLDLAGLRTAICSLA